MCVVMTSSVYVVLKMGALLQADVLPQVYCANRSVCGVMWVYVDDAQPPPWLPA